MGVVTFVVTWWGIVKQKTANSLRISGLGWCHQESNRGHKDFQSFALPTELWHHRVVAWVVTCGCLDFCVAKVGTFFLLCKFLLVFLSFLVFGGVFGGFAGCSGCSRVCFAGSMCLSLLCSVTGGTELLLRVLNYFLCYRSQVRVQSVFFWMATGNI